MVCGECHSFDSQHRVVSAEGWIVNGQQHDEYLHSPHNMGTPHYDYINCVTCHNPHQGVSYNQGGIKENPDCQTCHPGHIIPGKEFLDCIDCHMPFAVKSAVETEPFKADMRSHIFKIWITEFPKDSLFYTDSSGTFLKLDEYGNAPGMTLDLVCLRCHSNWNIQDVLAIAQNIHTEGLEAEKDFPSQSLPAGFALLQNHPNPFNSRTKIQFYLKQEGFTILAIYNLQGKLVESLFSDIIQPGFHTVEFDGGEIPSGIYICRLISPGASSSRKIVLLK